MCKMGTILRQKVQEGHSSTKRSVPLKSNLHVLSHGLFFFFWRVGGTWTVSYFLSLVWQTHTQAGKQDLTSRNSLLRTMDPKERIRKQAWATLLWSPGHVPAIETAETSRNKTRQWLKSYILTPFLFSQPPFCLHCPAQLLIKFSDIDAISYCHATNATSFRRQFAVLLNINNMEKLKGNSVTFSAIPSLAMAAGDQGAWATWYLPCSHQAAHPADVPFISCLQRHPTASTLKFLRYHAN